MNDLINKNLNKTYTHNRLGAVDSIDNGKIIATCNSCSEHETFVSTTVNYDCSPVNADKIDCDCSYSNADTATVDCGCNNVNIHTDNCNCSCFNVDKIYADCCDGKESTFTEKVLIVGVNSQYIHSLLSVYYIQANSKWKNLSLIECNINMPLDSVLSLITSYNPKIVAFSTYIFNINFIQLVSAELRKLGITVIFGGIEAENNQANALDHCDYLLLGDGETVFDKFLFGDRSEKIVKSSEVANLSTIKSPYTEEYFSNVSGKIAYFEASRGCPFRCSYCMSSLYDLQLGSLPRVFEDLEKFQGRNIKVLKFVDRTFNANKDYANAIIKYLVANEDKYDFQMHFEIAPELIGDEMIKLLQSARPNFIRVEIGMQSLNHKTLKKINRPFDIDKLKSSINKITSLSNIESHVDIIAGLPFENFQSLSETFDALYRMNPTEVQLGMLKLLPNSPLEKENIDGYIWEKVPPYQIKASPELSATEVEEILRTEHVVNRIHNSNRFQRTLIYAFKNFNLTSSPLKSPFKLFYTFAIATEDFHKLSLFELYGVFLNFLVNNGLDRDVLISLMRVDLALVNTSRQLPPSLHIPYKKKYHVKFDKSRYYLLPIFHDVFNNNKSLDMLLLIDYHNFNHLKKEFSYTIV